MNEFNEDSVFQNSDDVYNKKINTIPKPEKEIGIDNDKTLLDNIINAGLSNSIDISSINSFSQTAQTRDSVYQLIDTMCQDPTIAAVLETYSEDATEYNDKGNIVWVESSDADAVKFITYLLNSLNVDKNIYKWVNSLCKYGDLYLKLYRESEYEDNIFSEKKQLNEDLINKRKSELNESVVVKDYKKNDNFVHYVEMVSNPAEIFELTKFGKTYGFIKAPVNIVTTNKTDLLSQYQKYSFNTKDIEIYGPAEFVHASLDDNVSRTKEEVDLIYDVNEKDSNKYSYTVKRGQSLFYNVFKVWRELMLLQNSVLLNRVTKSSIIRLLNVEVGDMDKNQVQPLLQGIKQLVEQKAALNTNNSMSEYTNPGPIENTIYVPSHNGKGVISASQIGGDVDVKSLADLDYFDDKLFGALRVPKAYFGKTDDGAGFNGGTSLSIISSRYAKMIKRIQNTIIQAITDVINIMLVDKKLDRYINKFQIRMQAPTTQEEIDRRDNTASKIQITRDVMDICSDISSDTIKLKILKTLLSTSLPDSEITQLLQEQIDEIEKEKESDEPEISFKDETEPLETIEDDQTSFDDFELPEEQIKEESLEEDKKDDEDLPSPSKLGIDMTQL